MTCVVDYSQQPPVFRCTHCNGTSPLSLPLQIDQVVALVETFQRQHADCEKKHAPKWADVLKTLK